MKSTPWFFVSLLALAAGSLRAADATASLQNGFAEPPAEARPTVRWWWFGPAVVKPQLEREMKLMKEGGFGGFEVQPTYPLALDGQYPGLKNLKFLSPEFFDLIGFTAAKSKELGLRMDLTLGSGWPYGGPMFTREEAVQSIRDAGTVEITPGQTSVAPPPPAAGGRGGRGAVAGPLVAALLGPVNDAAPGASAWLPLPIENDAAQLPADLHGATQVKFFGYAQAGLMQVKRPAYGAEGFIVDHYSPPAIAKFIDQIAAPEIAACGPNPPYSIFCDSLEIAGEGWTPNLPAEFKRRRGYDLLPLLPALFDTNFPKAAEIRADYGRTVAEVFDDAFVAAFTKLAHDHGTRFRIQAYGTPPTTLSTYARADIDEGENYNTKAFSGTRWAASASHLLGRAVTSSEAFTWLHSPVFMAAPLDIKAESNLQFLNGINQLLFHGWPYTAPGVEYPGWRFYAAAVFDEKNPWWIVMPDVTKYLARVGYLLRQGNPANDVALYLPEEDAFTNFTPTSLEMAAASGRGILNRLVSAYIPPIVDAGYNFDFVDDGLLLSRGRAADGALAFGGSSYRVVVLPNVARIPLAALRRLEEFANRGGILIAVGHAPSQAPGYLATDADHAAIRDLSARLFNGANAKGVLVASETQLAAALQAKLAPDVKYASAQPNLGFVHRRTDGGEIYYLSNTSAQPIADTAVFRVTGLQAEWWNPVTGRTSPAKGVARTADGISVPVSLPPYGAEFLVFTKRTLAASATATANVPPLDLSRGWDVSFKNASGEADPAPQHFDALVSWTENPATHFFSGVAAYEKQIDVPAALLARGLVQSLDFGAGEATNVAGGGQGYRANFQPPIGDAAVVYVNGRRAGSVWCPPYRVDVTGLLTAGTNRIRIEVANRAVNYMADREHHPLPDYTALNADRTYGGNRFQAQDMNRIQPTPSGLLGTVQLLAEAGAE
ncbi:MAG TPA: glycosyl hydrolase [Opitutaceae bacterium]|nr:glycosyl hydrolase [Opitutaceae bacterium]